LSARHNDVSDADWQVFLQLRDAWQEPSAATAGKIHELPKDGQPEALLQAAIHALRALKIGPVEIS
jgi:hypothetical protein